MIALAAGLGQALVQAMVSDGWNTARERFAGTLSRGNKDRQARTEQQLDETAASVRDGSLDSSTASSRWQGRLEAWLEENPDGATEMRTLLSSMQRQISQSATRAQTANASGNAIINQAGRDLAGRDIDNSKRTNFGGLAVVLAVAVTLLIVGGWGVVKVISWAGSAVQSTTITKDTPCSEYLEASTEDRGHAVKSIGVELGATGAGNPMAPLNVDYSCGQRPNTPVGDVIARQNY
jgi:hypothetical protein